jgi:uncharacterized protein YdiU (UPF0061 family)
MQEPSAPSNKLHLSNSYAEQLPGFYVDCHPMLVETPELLQFNRGLASELGLEVADLHSSDLAQIFSGQKLLAGSRPLAQAYAGHQFGGFSPQLGDGRALLLGEVTDPRGQLYDIAIKGSGRTPFSRGGDGKAAIGPVLREYLMGEAMHALGIPTTRALAAVTTGELVQREHPLPGAILTRVAASHIRVGTFQFFAARQQTDQVRQLADYVIERHFPDLAEHENDQRYLSLIDAVAERQASLIAKWMLVGFIHGVMNTDNMAISGETIDYGPCAMMDSYNPKTVFSSIDKSGRYAYENQPRIAQWNLARFAETLLPLINESDPKQAVSEVEPIIHGFIDRYEAHHFAGAHAKLGLEKPVTEVDNLLVEDWLDLLEEHAIDYTLAWRRLADSAEGNAEDLEALFPSTEIPAAWLKRWRKRIAEQSAVATVAGMRSLNPIYIPRNHLVEEALSAATNDADLVPFEKLLTVMTQPYDERPEYVSYTQPASRDFTACYKTFCGT